MGFDRLQHSIRARAGAGTGMGAAGPRLFHQPPVLMYHRLTSRTGSHPCSLAVERFSRQLALLRTLGYRSTSPAALAAALEGGPPLPARTVVITFDDGYLDTLAVALPLLRATGFTATCYFVAGAIGRVSGWTDPAPLMDWAGIRAWHAAGMEVGAHSVTHADLTTLGPAALKDEVAGARACLEDRLGSAVTSFAYPFNRVEGRVMHAVAAAGYTSGVAGPETRRSPYALSRVDGARRSWARFALGLLPAYPVLRGAYRTLLPRRAA
jgi:peptidoglycan/xylan/chitin deacetylase (PgdA/CDA1 family)